MRLLLDTNVLRKLCFPERYPEADAWFADWLELAETRADVQVVVSAAAEYELRRGLLWKAPQRPSFQRALNRLAENIELCEVQPITNEVLQLAAELWADARRSGYSTAPERHVDWDVILAAQAKLEPATVITSNARHLLRYGIEACDWDELRPE